MGKVDVNDLIGIPFKREGRDKDGMDCQGVAIEVLSRYNIELENSETDGMNIQKISVMLSNSLHEHIDISEDWVEIDKPEEPCLITMRVIPPFVSHVGVYIGNKQFIHVLKNKFGGTVCVNKINQHPWRDNIVGYYRKK